MNEQPKPAIRRAGPADIAAAREVVDQAYMRYVERIGRKPGPMLDDYSLRQKEGTLWVLEASGSIAGILVLIDMHDHLLLDNIAVAPPRQGQGFGHLLLDFAAGEAARRGYREMRLYTHTRMTENRALYRRLGWEEYARGEEKGYARVFMRKPVPPSAGRASPLTPRNDPPPAGRAA